VDNLLTQIESPCVVSIPASYPNRSALAVHIQALIAQGHAIVVDEQYEERPNRDTHGELRLCHHRTCERCKKGVL
jgi:hypothetical protein